MRYEVRTEAGAAISSHRTLSDAYSAYARTRDKLEIDRLNGRIEDSWMPLIVYTVGVFGEHLMTKYDMRCTDWDAEYD